MSKKKRFLYLLTFVVLAALGCKDQESAEPEGIWQKNSIGTLELKENSLFTFTASAQDHTDSQGRYSLTENHITFEDDTCYNPGTYTYEVSKKQITFTLSSDTCEDRVRVLSGTWSRQRLRE